LSANFGLLSLSHTLYISPTTHNPFSTPNTMSASTQHSDPDSSHFPEDSSMQTFGPKNKPDIVIRPRKTNTRKGKSVRTDIEDAACAPWAFDELGEVEQRVKNLKDIYLQEMWSGSQTVDGSRTGLREKVQTAIGPRYDESNPSRPNVTVFVCYNGDQYRQVLKNNPHLVDWKSSKRGAIGEDLSETPTVSKPSVAEDANPDDYHSHRGRQIDSKERGTCTASDPEGDGGSDVEEDEDSINTKRRLSGTRIERIGAKRFGA
jgi:hypothetical protein